MYDNFAKSKLYGQQVPQPPLFGLLPLHHARQLPGPSTSS